MILIEKGVLILQACVGPPQSITKFITHIPCCLLDLIKITVLTDQSLDINLNDEFQNNYSFLQLWVLIFSEVVYKLIIQQMLFF